MLDAGTNFNINIAGNWTASGGGFNPVSGQVIFDGAQDQDITSGGNAFNVLDIAGSGIKSMLDNLSASGDRISAGRDSR